jgi:spore germination cell wall hydrolase CwlJ-like protein
LSNASRPKIDLPLALMISILAVGGGAYLAQKTAPAVKSPVMKAVFGPKSKVDWFAEFSLLDAAFTDARLSGNFVMAGDATMTGSLPGALPKGDKLPAKKTVGQAPQDPAADPFPGKQAALTTSAKAVAFGALAPAPWLKIRVSATGGNDVAAAAAAPKLAASQPPMKPIDMRVPRADADTTALGYAREDNPAERPFRSLFKDGTEEGTVSLPKGMPPNMHDWAYVGLKSDVWDKRQQKCLAEAIYFESRGESERGQAAVAQVVLNRVKNPAYPDTICEVVYQNAGWIDHCQFSFACDGRKEIVTEPDAWDRAKRIATDVTAGRIYDKDVADATHYHAYWVRPDWKNTMKKVATIGVHRFYRTYGGGWI